MRIVFQGDSITDALRDRENDQRRGMGYVTLIAAELGAEYPGQYEFINRGVSGNRITNLLARMKADMINLKPDVLSILVGVNDVWHEVTKKNGVDSELYEKIYDLLIEELKKALPDLRIIIMEPFVLYGTATAGNWDVFRSEVGKRAAAARRVAEKNGLEFVCLQEIMAKAADGALEGYWLIDGVHPTAMGHELIAKEGIKSFLKMQEVDHAGNLE